VFGWRGISAIIPNFTQGVNKWIELGKRGIREFYIWEE